MQKGASKGGLGHAKTSERPASAAALIEQMAWNPKHDKKPNIGTLIIRIGFCGPLYHNDNQEPTKQYWQLFQPI